MLLSHWFSWFKYLVALSLAYQVLQVTDLRYLFPLCQSIYIIITSCPDCHHSLLPGLSPGLLLMQSIPCNSKNSFLNCSFENGLSFLKKRWRQLAPKWYWKIRLHSGINSVSWIYLATSCSFEAGTKKARQWKFPRIGEVPDSYGGKKTKMSREVGY